MAYAFNGVPDSQRRFNIIPAPASSGSQPNQYYITAIAQSTCQNYVSLGGCSDPTKYVHFVDPTAAGEMTASQPPV